MRIGIAAAAMAIIAAAPAQAAVIASGSFGADESVFQDGALTLGPGRYRFVLTVTTPLQFQGSSIQKSTVTDFICFDPDIAPGEFPCGGDDVPTIYDLAQVTPTRFETLVTVDPASEVPFNSPPIIRYRTFDTCCTFAVDLVSAGAGAYELSFAAVPEPSIWALMIAGVGGTGAGLRRRSRTRVTA